MTMSIGLQTSNSYEWSTPQALFDALNQEFGPFDLDVCASANNAKCPAYFTREQDGLAQEWRGRVWMNPPYGREIRAWLAKAYRSAQAGALVVCLLPARVDTGWWHDFAARGDVRFLRGRLHFAGPSTSGHNAPFPSAVVVFRPAEACI